MTFVDVIVTGSTCIWPGENQTMIYTNLVGTGCNIEVDKLATDVIFNNVNLRKIHTQSSSVDNLTINGGTFTETGSCAIDGTPKNAIFSNLITPCLKLGPLFYGVGHSASCSTCSIGNVQNVFGNQVKGALTGFDLGANVVYTVSSGVFSLPWNLPVWIVTGKQVEHDALCPTP